jgi:hypothetical protein
MYWFRTSGLKILPHELGSYSYIERGISTPQKVHYQLQKWHSRPLSQGYPGMMVFLTPPNTTKIPMATLVSMTCSTHLRKASAPDLEGGLAIMITVIIY